jgi:hypothetical protein
MKVAVFVLWSALAASLAPAFAQEQDLVLGPEFEQRFEELAKWLREYRAWEEWFERWGNRVARNFNDQHIWERKQRPEPPVWLEEECKDYLDFDGLLASACDILRNWDDQPLLLVQRRRSSLVTSSGRVDDKVVKSSFFQRVHLTGLWMRARYPATPLYGIVGIQVAVFEVGRYTLPAIGAMLVMVPDGEGGHDWKPATTLGFGFRICDFVPPLIKKPASLHFNIARTSIHGVQDERFLPQGTMNVSFFGLSVSAKKRR